MLSPGTTASTTGWKYVGCNSELSSGRALAGWSINPPNMTIELCMDYCTEKNFRYAGLEYSQECCTRARPRCPMANARLPARETLSSSGRGGRLSLFENTAYVPASNAQRIGPWSYVSCYMEPQKGRALPDRPRSAANMTAEACYGYCDSGGMPWAGLENGRECWCGKALRQRLEDASDPMCAMHCDMACLGNDSSFVGGAKTINIWRKYGASVRRDMVVGAATENRREVVVQRREEMLREHKQEAGHGVRFARMRRAVAEAPIMGAVPGVV
ncbi:hypothetical protein MAPG_09100 [Magnaporthiopsis poae ATCC 64411]|uniref:WSC domain-containing protein n=1 Tax=Magnaporthiopsis poae (strain ATCC 64411 / 73-15) TaxID=644358 RepID=A0A0C4E924_MAGP6|nr:hypothetical protein MAPG_09100 [Magnaporthiopsis poae ATCC 64411]